MQLGGESLRGKSAILGVLKEEGGSQGQACLSGDLEHDWSNLNVF